MPQDSFEHEARMREAVWIAIHSAVDAPAEQITLAAARVMDILKEQSS